MIEGTVTRNSDRPHEDDHLVTVRFTGSPKDFEAVWLSLAPMLRGAISDPNLTQVLNDLRRAGT